MPAVLVSGDMMFNVEPLDLSEDTIALNLNPAGTPYGGTSDADTADVYPSWIGGPVYVSGNATIQNDATTVKGMVVVAGNLTIEDKASVRVLYAKPSQPVPGFARITGMNLSSGSLKRVVN